ncbi:hypothetical protein [Sinomicrobium sp. M5D2P17]
MKSTAKISLLLFIGLTFLSCDQTSPRKYVEVTVLNTNLVTSRYTPSFFEELRELEKQGRIAVFKDGEMKKGTAEEYVMQNAIAPVDVSIKKVKELEVKDDTHDLIAASLDVLQYSKEVFENEYRNIAEMLDTNRSQAEIDSAIHKLFRTYDREMEKKLRHLDELAIPYAEKHNIPLNFR